MLTNWAESGNTATQLPESDGEDGEGTLVQGPGSGNMERLGIVVEPDAVESGTRSGSPRETSEIDERKRTLRTEQLQRKTKRYVQQRKAILTDRSKNAERMEGWDKSIRTVEQSKLALSPETRGNVYTLPLQAREASEYPLGISEVSLETNRLGSSGPCLSVTANNSFRPDDSDLADKI